MGLAALEGLQPRIGKCKTVLHSVLAMGLAALEGLQPEKFGEIQDGLEFLQWDWQRWRDCNELSPTR